ncbi:MAG: CDP-alcohol phosphatidyltransferase family protein [Coriobacteriia bacterium]|nr:CDP-alcohol phosphatidyltransferase family protein [Coriobacteriia bacterium]
MADRPTQESSRETSQETSQEKDTASRSDDLLRQVYTVPNLITLIRFMMVPLAFSVLIGGAHDILAFVLFAVAGASDFLDGQIARRTNQVSELGKLIDPFVDRFLIAAGLIGLYIVGRLPLWILVILIARDLILLLGTIPLHHFGIGRIDVLFAGKTTTVFLLAGFSWLIANIMKIPGLGLTRSPALPGFNAQVVPAGIWLVYIGTALSIITFACYIVIALKLLRRAR